MSHIKYCVCGGIYDITDNIGEYVDIAESDKKIESYLSNTLGFKLSNIHYMVTESELGIIEIKL